MSGKIKGRLAAFVFGIGLMVALSVWTALASWKRINEMREKLAAVQSESFHLADHFQQTILGLNNLLLRYQAWHDVANWQRFLQMSEELNTWITRQAPTWSTPEQQGILQQLQASYQTYMAQARLLERQRKSGESLTPSLAEFAPFEAQSEHLLELGYQLADAHRKSLNSFLVNSNITLAHLRNVLLGSLMLLLAFGAGLALVIYQQLIAPLQLRIIESRELLARQEKLASLGMLAAGIAHEIRNPLTAMKARLFTLQRVLERDSPGQPDLEVINGEVNRLERIVKDFLLFARPSEPVLEKIGADQPLREVHALMASTLEKANIRLTLDKLDPLPIRADIHQIKQVLINLVQNAAESIGQNGSIMLRARQDIRRLDGQTTEVVILEVSDSGKGIPPEVQKRLFDPFFTTKEGGTGLGLSIVARIVEKHDGVLQLQSQVNRGSTFGIVLPLAK